MNLMDVFVKIGADTSGLVSSLGQVGSIVSSGMKVAGAAIAAATAAVGGFAASAINVGKEFDSSMSQVAATMGVSVDEIGELRDYALEMGRTTQFSATQAADALNYMALAGYDAETSMNMLPNVLNLAAAGGMELATASDMVTDAQSALGLSLEETSQLVDMMAQTASKSNTSVQQLGDAILTIGGTAQNLAGGTTELNAALGILADNGIKGSEGGTALRNVILSLSAPTDNAAAMLEKLGVTTTDASGNLLSLDDIMGQLNTSLEGMGTAEKAEIISTIFNKTDIAAVNALLGTDAERWEELSYAIDSAWYTSESLNDSLTEVAGISFDKLQSNVESLGVSQETLNDILALSGGNAENFKDMLLEAADAGTTEQDVLEALGGDLENLQTAFDETTGAAAQMAATQMDNLAGDMTFFQSALEGAKIAISDKLTPSLRKFVQFGTDGLSKITEAFDEGGLEGAMAAFGEVLSEGLNMVIEILPQAMDAGMQLLGALGQGIMDNLPVLLDSAIAILESLGSALITAIPVLLEGVITILSTLGTYLVEQIPVIVPSIVELMGQILNILIENLPTLITGLQTIMASLAVAIAENAPTLIPAIIELIVSIVNTLIENAPMMIDATIQCMIAIGQALIDNAPLIWDGIVSIFNTVVELVTNVDWIQLGKDVIGFIKEGIENLMEDIPQALKDICDNAIEWVTNIDWYQLGKDVITFICEGIAFLVDNIPKALQDICDTAVEWVTSIDWLDLGKNIVLGIKDGIVNAADFIVDAIVDMCSGAWDAVCEFFGIASPSKLMKYAGKMVDEGFAIGVTQNMGIVDKAMESLNNAIAIEPIDASYSFDSTTQATGQNDIIRLLQEIASNKNVTVVLEGDADKLFRVIQTESIRYHQTTGEASFA